MNPRGNPAPLDQARRRTSLDKRQHALTALETLEHHGTKITFTAVARTAGVSTWLTYAPGIREHIEAARTRQTHPAVAPPAAGQRPDPAALRTEVDLARHEIRQLREERDRLRGALATSWAGSSTSSPARTWQRAARNSPRATSNWLTNSSRPLPRTRLCAPASPLWKLTSPQPGPACAA